MHLYTSSPRDSNVSEANVLAKDTKVKTACNDPLIESKVVMLTKFQVSKWQV